MDNEKIFWALYRANTEKEVSEVLKRYDFIQNPENWKFYGGQDSNYAVVENQQASPIPALIEKITNSIDAILMRACIERGVDPRSEEAPRSIEEAVNLFFPENKDWDLHPQRRKQAERLQILADGPKFDTALTVYDNGEGQAPEDFPKTFLSLLRGNKNDIRFVQGKYNMGGSGAIVFCGKQRYQLVGSKRFDGDGRFGFTLIRRHPLTPEEENKRKSTWYEYLVIDSRIPSFLCEALDLNLHNRKFETGTVLKLYSYDLPAGSRSVISRDLNRSINEYLFNPALPVFTIDRPERYPDDRNLERELYGLKRQLEDDNRKYVEHSFSENDHDPDIGFIKVTCYVFKPRMDGRNVKETRATIRREFFKNDMSVLFSVNGQVHGHYTSEFITRSLQFNLLKDYLLIHVDCTRLRTEFRNELFMASRDRLKQGDESRSLRRKLADLLKASRLKEINKQRKSAITVDSDDAEEVVRNLARNFPLQEELTRLIQQTFQLDKQQKGKRPENVPQQPKEQEKHPEFNPERYPSIFEIDAKSRSKDGFPLVKLPLNGERAIKFSTDVEDQYFDRVEDHGELDLDLIDHVQNDITINNPDGLSTVLGVVKSSPHNGSIRVRVKATKEVSVGDEIKIRASLSSPDRKLEQIFMVKISDPEKTPGKLKEKHQPDARLGLPRLVMVYKDPDKERQTWEKLEGVGIPMDHETVVYLQEEENSLSDVYINMDSSCFLKHRAKLHNQESLSVANNRYISLVYFHTLFLYTITKKHKYGVVKESGDEGSSDGENVPVTEYISNLFQSYYAQFLLNFEGKDLIETLDS